MIERQLDNIDTDRERTMRVCALHLKSRVPYSTQGHKDKVFKSRFIHNISDVDSILYRLYSDETVRSNNRTEFMKWCYDSMHFVTNYYFSENRLLWFVSKEVWYTLLSPAFPEGKRYPFFARLDVLSLMLCGEYFPRTVTTPNRTFLLDSSDIKPSWKEV